MEEFTLRATPEQIEQAKEFFRGQFWDEKIWYQNKISSIKTLYTNQQQLESFSQQHDQNMHAIHALCHSVIKEYNTTRLIYADKMLKVLYGGDCSLSEKENGEPVVECKPCTDTIKELQDINKLEEFAKMIKMEKEVIIVQEALSNILSRKKI